MSDLLRKQFAKNMTRAPRRAGLSQEELGFRAELHRTEIGMLEQGIRLPRLATDAKALGQWDERRPSALSLLRHPEPDPPETMRHPSCAAADARSSCGCCSGRAIRMPPGRPQAREAAGEGGCSRDLWLKLADLRRAKHPEDTLGVYRRHVEDVIAGKDKRAYAEAVRLIDEMRALCAESGRPEDFDAYVEEVRTSHKAKRNLMKLMAGLEPVELTCD
ncbi:MAG: hypothetical protein JJE35_10820 [Thermoleophilia bacterium]|nr:hypothetical protein [Thermoleophilia bacterium]